MLDITQCVLFILVRPSLGVTSNTWSLGPPSTLRSETTRAGKWTPLDIGSTPVSDSVFSTQRPWSTLPIHLFIALCRTRAFAKQNQLRTSCRGNYDTSSFTYWTLSVPSLVLLLLLLLLPQLFYLPKSVDCNILRNLTLLTVLLVASAPDLFDSCCFSQRAIVNFRL